MLLITPSEVIALAFTSRETISTRSIRTLKIDIAQEHFIRPRLGQELYEELLENRHRALVDEYIKPALAQFVRYGVVGELSIEVSDLGALVYSSSTGHTNDENNKTQDTTSQDQHKIEKNTMDDTSNKVVDNDTVTQTGQTIDERLSYKDPLDATRTFDNHNIQRQSDDTMKSDQTTTTTKIGAIEEIGSSTGSQKQVDKAQQNTLRKDEQLRAATPIELKVLAQRALSDGNILLAKAVRHIERRVELYPSYVSSSFSSKIFF